MPRDEMTPIQLYLNPDHLQMLEDLKASTTRNTSDMVRHCIIQEWNRMQIANTAPVYQQTASHSVSAS
ncbi:hypothetical protein ACFLZW_06105 [Chloroflexota bacterium]